MYVMTDWLIPCRVRQNAFRNGTGAAGPVDGSIAGFSYSPGKPVELIIGVGEHRYYDIPLSFTGMQGGAQYAMPDTHEVPWCTMEPRPRRVTALRLPYAPSAVGHCHGALTWERGNVTLLVIVLDAGEVVLWPPHKLVWSDTPQPLPGWLKRRYADDSPPLSLTRVWEEDDSIVMARLEVAQQALLGDEGWRPHGIGLVQKYMPGPEGSKQYRVHVWIPDAVRIGLESGIHSHRYDLRSTVVAGVLTQEEWSVVPATDGMWCQWEHHNDTLKPIPTGQRFHATPRTLDIRSGQTYSFPRTGYHRSVPRSAVAITVVERFDVVGTSHALCPVGHTPVNGQTIDLPTHMYIAQARKHLGI